MSQTRAARVRESGHFVELIDQGDRYMLALDFDGHTHREWGGSVSQVEAFAWDAIQAYRRGERPWVRDRTRSIRTGGGIGLTLRKERTVIDQKYELWPHEVHG